MFEMLESWVLNGVCPYLTLYSEGQTHGVTERALASREGETYDNSSPVLCLVQILRRRTQTKYSAPQATEREINAHSLL